MKKAREFSLTEIAKSFDLARMGTSPAVGRRGVRGGWYIRIRTAVAWSGDQVTEKYDYFYLDPDGTIVTAPLGYARNYKPGRVIDIEVMGPIVGEGVA